MSEQAKRYCIDTEDGNFYLFVSNKALVVTTPFENAQKNMVRRTILETLCEVSSLALESGVPLTAIKDRFLEGDMGRRTIVAKIADRVSEFINEHSGE